MLTRPLPLLMTLAALTACNAVDAMKEGFAHSQAVSNKLQKATGLKSFVGFSRNNGSLTSANVTFRGLPKHGTLTSGIAA